MLHNNAIKVNSSKIFKLRFQKYLKSQKYFNMEMHDLLECYISSIILVKREQLS